jgi:hypothetical protein
MHLVRSKGRLGWFAVPAVMSAALVVARPEGFLYYGATLFLIFLEMTRRLMGRLAPRIPPAATAAAAVLLLVALAGLAFAAPQVNRQEGNFLPTLHDNVVSIPFDDRDHTERPIRAYLVHYAVLSLGDYGFGLFAIVAAFGLMTNSTPRRSLLDLLLFLPGAIFLLAPTINPIQPFFMRRFFPSVLAGLFVLACLALAEPNRWAVRRPRADLAVRSALPVAIIAFNVLFVGGLYAEQGNDVSPAQLERFYDAFPADEPIVFAKGKAEGFEPPGYFVFGKETYLTPFFDFVSTGQALVPQTSTFTPASARERLQDRPSWVVYSAGQAIDPDYTEIHPYYFPFELSPQWNETITYSQVRPTGDVKQAIRDNGDSFAGFRAVRALVGDLPPDEVEDLTVDLRIFHAEGNVRLGFEAESNGTRIVGPYSKWAVRDGVLATNHDYSPLVFAGQACEGSRQALDLNVRSASSGHRIFGNAGAGGQFKPVAVAEFGLANDTWQEVHVDLDLSGTNGVQFYLDRDLEIEWIRFGACQAAEA